MEEIAPGLHRWTARHEEWEEDVGSLALETDDGLILIDPIDPPRDLRRPDHVLITVFWHYRSTREAREALGLEPHREGAREPRRHGHRSDREERAPPRESSRSRPRAAASSSTGSPSRSRSRSATCFLGLKPRDRRPASSVSERSARRRTTTCAVARAAARAARAARARLARQAGPARRQAGARACASRLSVAYCAVQPPSTTTLVPFTSPALRDARKMTAAATSPVVPTPDRDPADDVLEELGRSVERCRCARTSARRR